MQILSRDVEDFCVYAQKFLIMISDNKVFQHWVFCAYTQILNSDAEDVCVHAQKFLIMISDNEVSKLFSAHTSKNSTTGCFAPCAETPNLDQYIPLQFPFKAGVELSSISSRGCSSDVFTFLPKLEFRFLYPSSKARVQLSLISFQSQSSAVLKFLQKLCL